MVSHCYADCAINRQSQAPVESSKLLYTQIFFSSPSGFIHEKAPSKCLGAIFFHALCRLFSLRQSNVVVAIQCSETGNPLLRSFLPFCGSVTLTVHGVIISVSRRVYVLQSHTHRDVLYPFRFSIVIFHRGRKCQLVIHQRILRKLLVNFTHVPFCFIVVTGYEYVYDCCCSSIVRKISTVSILDPQHTSPNFFL